MPAGAALRAAAQNPVKRSAGGLPINNPQIMHNVTLIRLTVIRIKAGIPGEFADIWRLEGGKKKTENPSFCSESGFCAAR